MPTNIREIGFEEYIEQKLVDLGYRKRLDSQYRKDFAMDGELVMEFIRATQPKELEKLSSQHGEATGEQVLARIDQEIADRGLLDVLRKGISDHGVRLQLAYYAPESGLNPEIGALYDNNILSATRQVHYSDQNGNSIDMVLFLNGLPIWTIELKNQLSGQTVADGIRQYKTDRDPKERLLGFKRCLAHWAVDAEQAWVSTRLAGLKTRFLPFNKGWQDGAGNPPNPNGYKTEYVWADTWTRDSVLDLVGRFLHLQIEEAEDENGRKTRKETLIFPRYHQLDAVRRLIAHAREQGAGQKYLIQHSAGSGKSNTIAWTAHRLANLYQPDGASKAFDSVVVITDRKILDRQLSETVESFEQVRGTVVHVASGKELQEALERGVHVVVSTLQKFPVIVDAMQEMAGKRFAVIIDEAHSSQTGEAAAAVRQVLAEYADLDDAEQKDARDEEPTDEDVILKKLRSRRVETTNVSFFAFTATPKQKTLELFGAKDPTSGKFYPFSLYSMKQAIDERFILDVLKNYTTYETYFALQKRIADDPEFDHAKAQRLLVGFVDRHEHAIDKKVAIIVEHFHDRIARLIGGQAKAMIVTRSRLHAVRFRQALDRYLLAHGYPYQALVAFSGLVRDGAGEYTESRMNGGVPEKSTADEFKKNEYKFLVVAEKFQTGFDQPLLEAMYVDKKLSGVNAVQTLSRLNRTHADKDDAYVVDFVNTAEEISDAFEPYYTTTILSRATDPNILHDLERDLYAYKLFTVHEVQGFADEYFKNAPAAKLNSFLDEVVRRYVVLRSDEQDEVRSKLNDYIRKYAFVSQIVSFEDAALERLYVFAKLLRRKLPIPKNPLPYDVLEAVDMESYKVQKREDVRIQLGGVVKELEPMGTGGDAGQVNDEKDPLSAIIQEMNERFGTSFNLEDRVILNTLSKKLAISDPLKAAIRNNSRDAAKLKFDEIFQKELVGMLNNHFDLYQKLDQNPELKEFVNTKLFDYIQSNLKNANE